ncbi:MAG: hypothetical protein BWK80_40185 [Desulfobacteraceae bacterium IS3]|nr:MAG: hypothetical protein BWK80_40185 [Desulfobacteraceae bacterium IS3]
MNRLNRNQENPLIRRIRVQTIYPKSLPTHNPCRYMHTVRTLIFRIKGFTGFLSSRSDLPGCRRPLRTG